MLRVSTSRLLIACAAILTLTTQTLGQSGSCTGNTPFFNVDLSASPTMTYTSPAVSRDGSCCNPPDNNCIEFQITLHQDAVAINFQIASGAVPTGSLFYQINCGPVQTVGSPICLNGPGPFTLTFCKPGNNQNTFAITSYSEPTFGPDMVANEGCNSLLYANYYDESSITWNSISPGASGQYNGNLSCLTGCDTTYFTPVAGMPSPIQYKVCGNDINGCYPDTVCGIIEVTPVDAPSIDIQADTLFVCSPNDSTWISPSFNNSQPYSITWSNGSTADSIYVGPGWHYLTLDDTAGCSSYQDSVFVGVETMVTTADAGPDLLFCHPPSIAINGTVTNGQNILWSGGNGSFNPANTESTTYFPNQADYNAGQIWLYLSAGSITNCPGAIDSLEITFADWQGVPVISSSDVSCFGGNDGSASVIVNNGQYGPFQYELNNGGQTSNTVYNNLSAGTYSMTITNSLGCDTTVTFVINEPSTLSVSNAGITNVSCFGGSDGSVSVSASGGTPPYNYNWGGAFPNNATLNNIPAATYTVVVTDNNGCTANLSLTVSEPAVLSNNFSFTPIACNGQTTSVTSNAGGGTASYFYSWNGMNGSSTANLGAGTHQLTLTDANGCILTENITLTEPAVLVVSLPNDTSVCQGSTQALTATVSGGSPGYNYSWSHDNTQTGQTASATVNGPMTITIQVTDQNGCSASDQITYSLVVPPTVDLNNDTLFLCPSETHTWVAALVNNPTSNGYNISWSNGSSVDSAYLTYGQHYVQVQDITGCESDVDSIVITQQPVITSVDAGADQVVCANAQVQLNGTVINGVNVSWIGGAGFFGNFTSPNTTYIPTQNEIQNGTLTLYLQAQSPNNCPGDMDSTVLTFAELNETVQTNLQHVQCFGDNNGVAQVIVANGPYSPYTYSLNGGSSSGNNTFSNLGPGNYTVTITNTLGCTATENFTIIEPSLLQVNTLREENISCFGGNDGLIEVQAQGGTSPYQYNWGGGFPNSSLIQNLPAGSYTVVISDQNGCTANASYTLSEPNQLMNMFNASQIDCFGGQANISASVNGGVQPYTYLWNGQPGTSSITGNAGDYILQVTDANGCILASNISISEPPELEVSIPSGMSVCTNTELTLQASVAGGTPSYTFSWSHDSANNGSNASVIIASDTVFHFTAEDANGCAVQVSSTIHMKSVNPSDFVVHAQPDEICEGESTQLGFDYFGSTNIMELIWLNCDSCAFPTTVFPEVDSTFRARLITVCNDTLYDEIDIIVHPEPDWYISPDSAAVCPNVPITFQLDSGNVDEDWLFSWDLGGVFTSNLPSPTVAFPNSGFYQVNVTVATPFGCVFTSSNSAVVQIYPEPKAGFTVLEDSVSALNPVINFFNTTESGNFYEWDFGDGDTSTMIHPMHTFDEEGSYLVHLYAENLYGCFDEYVKEIIVEPDYTLFVPNAFSPDGDGLNEVFNPVHFQLNPKDFRFVIYDRWGHIIFESLDPDQGWDGRFSKSGDKCPVGVYTYVIYYRNLQNKIQRKTGNVTLVK